MRPRARAWGGAVAAACAGLVVAAAADVGAPSGTRVQRYPLAAFRSESPAKVEAQGSWWPEFVHPPEGLRTAVVGTPGSRLRVRVAEFAGARLAGRAEVRAQVAGNARAVATCSIFLESGGHRERLFDRTLAAGASAPFAIDLPAALSPDATLELAIEPRGAPETLANVAFVDTALTRSLPRPPGPRAQGRSIVLITADTLRQDEIGPYGGAARTPALDRLAASGATFLDVHSAAFGTAPSHASLFTSSPASQHGVFDNASVLRPASETLAETLSAAGYATAAFVGSSVLARSLGFDQGFDYYGDVFALDPLRKDDLPFQERDAAITVTRFVDWLNRSPSEPFFVWLHAYEAHQPYLPPAGWADPYLPPGAPLSLPIAYPRAADGSPVHLEEGALPRGLAVRPLAARARAGYRGEIAYLDSQVGRLLDALAAAGHGDAVVAFAADHGENLLEHGPALAFGHAGLHAEVTRLPLLLVAPGRVRAGERRAGLATNADLAPTLLELAGVAAPRAWRGRSLLRGAPHDAIVLEGAEREEIGVRTARWLYTWKGPVDAAGTRTPEWTEPGGQGALYDLAADPGEQRNLYRADHPAAAALAALVEPFRAPPPRAGRVDSEPHGEALRALGYVR